MRKPGECHKHKTLFSVLADGRLVFATISRHVPVVLLLISYYKLTQHLVIKGKKINMLKLRRYVLASVCSGGSLWQKCCRNECNNWKELF